MTDVYLLLTPLLVLGVLGLIRFIGCDKLFGLQPVETTIPTILGVIAGNQRIVIRWTYSAATAESFTVMYGTVQGGPYPDEVLVPVTDASQTLFTASVTGLTNSTKYYLVVNADVGDKTSGNSVEQSATPDPGFVLETMPLGPGLRNDIQGVVGMAITIGQDDVVVTHLGRIYFPGIPNDPQFPPNTQSHVVKIVDAANGMDVGSPVTIQMPGDTDNDYEFEALDQPA